MTNAQARILQRAIDNVQSATRDLSPDDLILVLYAMIDKRGDITPDQMDDLANDLGLSAHMKARMALRASPMLLEDMRTLEGVV